MLTIEPGPHIAAHHPRQIVIVQTQDLIHLARSGQNGRPDGPTAEMVRQVKVVGGDVRKSRGTLSPVGPRRDDATRAAGLCCLTSRRPPYPGPLVARSCAKLWDVARRRRSEAGTRGSI